MNTVNVRRRGYALGAEVTGIDASKPLSDTAINAIRQAWLDHVMIYLPGQDLDAEQMRAFCGQFGELDLFNTVALPRHPDLPEVLVRSNKPVAVDPAHEVRKSAPADQWHTDYSHSRRPATISFLLGKQLPSIGGDTMFANTTLAYDLLSPAYRAIVDNLQCVHDFTLASGYAARSSETQSKIRELKPPVVHPLAPVHPETGRRALFLGEGRVRNFVGMTEEETKPILDFLNRHATRYELIYRHVWTQSDIVIWDNRCSLHYAVQDYPAEMRMLLRCSLLGPETGKPYGAAAFTEAEMVPISAN